MKLEGENQYPVLRIGLRIYTEDGDKVDSDKRAFVGWSEAMDESIPAYSPRI